MAQIYNSDLSKEIILGARIQQNVDDVPNQLAEKVVPVMEVNPKLLRRVNIVKSARDSITGAAVIYTTSTINDFFLTGAMISAQEDATSDNIQTYISATIDGATVIILRLAKLTTTAFSGNMTMSFVPPLKIDKGAAISITNSFTVGAGTKTAVIFGYEDNSSKA